MRDVFDDWLIQRAQEKGAQFRDECGLLDFEEVTDGVIAPFATAGGAQEKVKVRYIVDATG